MMSNGNANTFATPVAVKRRKFGAVDLLFQLYMSNGVQLDVESMQKACTVPIGCLAVWKGAWDTYKCPTSWAATMMPLKPPVSSMMATLFTFSSRLLTTQAPPT